MRTYAFQQGMGKSKLPDTDDVSTAVPLPSKASTKRVCKTLEQMRGNPLDDWTIGDVEKVCREVGINCTPPSHGSHYKVSTEALKGALPIPARRPIKAVYIKQFVKFCDAALRHDDEVE